MYLLQSKDTGSISCNQKILEVSFENGTKSYSQTEFHDIRSGGCRLVVSVVNIEMNVDEIGL